ncbi:MAG: outer membrane protein assembly factor BamA [Myxococcota bacterium]|nr:outer membrane protein assembly factor BamA [Myxococcota bacterium]MDW8362644.1 outer membrane protein assembly factor BamA [Myxococcales bacterium]
MAGARLILWLLGLGSTLVAAPLRAQDEPDAPVEEPSTDEEGWEEPSPPAAIRTVCHGRRIRSVRVTGTRRVAPQDVLATVRLRHGLPCTDDEITRDARAVWDMGYFEDVEVLARPAGSDAVDLVWRVRERPAIGRIVFEGNDEIGDDDLDEKVTLAVGDVLSVSEVRRQVDRIRDLYAEKGFFLARVRPHVEPMGDDEVAVRFAIEEGPEVAVRRVRFVGNASIPARELLAVMQTSETGFWSFLTSSHRFDRDAFDEDVNRLQALYYERGFLAVSIGEPRVELSPDRRHIDVTVPVVEGPRFRIGRLRVVEVDDEGREIEPLLGRRRLRETIEADPGDWFSRSVIARSLLELTRQYRDRGHAHVEVAPDTELDMRRRVVHVVVRIRRGPRVRVERIQIRGNGRTRDSVIRREIELTEGEPYSQSAIERSRERIQALGYFERVDTSEEEGSAPDRIVVNFEVSERPTGTFQIGAGFSSVEAFVFTAQVQQQNLFGNGQSLALQLQLSGIRQLAQIRLVEPYLLGTEWTASVDAYKTIRQFQDFNRDATGASLSLGHPILSDRLRLFVEYGAEYVDVSARTGGLLGASGAAGFTQFQTSPLPNRFRDGLTSSVRLTLAWDSRDNRLFPSRGLYASASTELAETWLGSDNVFTRHRAFVRFYQPLPAGLVLKINVEGGLVGSRDRRGVPIFERFFLGGIFNVRGFPLNSLGPRIALPRLTDPNLAPSPYGLPVGGNAQLFYNVEIEIPLIEAVGIRGVLFTDGGNAWNLERQLCAASRPLFSDRSTDPCAFDPLSLRTSWGFGFRWLSPLGPLRFEWGLPFVPRAPLEDPILFEFTIGNFF